MNVAPEFKNLTQQIISLDLLYGRKKHKLLSLKERVVIETLLQEKKNKNYIAKTLKWARSTITREVNKWGVDYSATFANWNAKKTNLKTKF